MSALAIFGYGPGLGAGTAREFGRNGFRVAVIGRDPAAGAARRAARGGPRRGGAPLAAGKNPLARAV
ncbi:dehydrogenase, partial [Nocardia sp. NPDC050718]